MSGIKYNKEQKKIIRALSKKKNVLVTAVAGSGKTTTMLGVAGRGLKVLLLCYNNRLRADTIKKIEVTSDSECAFDEDIGMIDVHTFHSYCHSVLDEPLAGTDIGIIKIVNTREKFPLIYGSMIEMYDLIIVDEAQDLTSVYYNLLILLLDYTGASLCLIGDPRQAIYQFNGANEDYLVNADKHFDREFTRLTLSESFRLTKPMAKFINGMYGNSDITSNKKSKVSPIIIHRRAESSFTQIFNTIMKCPPGDVLVLMHSVKRIPNKMSVNLANELMKHGKKVSFGNLPPGNSDDDSILMLSYHQSKGLERPIVILLDLGSLYFNLSGEDSTTLPNLWYVAMTRAKDLLIAYIDTPFEFVNNGLMCIGKALPNDEVYKSKNENGNSFIRRKVSFDDYIKYTPSDVLWKIINATSNNNNKWLPLDGMSVIKSSPGSFIIDIIPEYVRCHLINGVTAECYLTESIKKLQGGLKYDIDLGECYYLGYPAMKPNEALTTCYRIFKHFCNVVGIPLIRIREKNKEMECGDKVVIGVTELYDIETGREIIVTADRHSLNTRIRSSFATSGSLVIDLFSAKYTVLE